jgi:GxxExxY protein
VENTIIVELKALEGIKDIHIAQVISYLKLAKLETGLLINFNTKSLKDGIRRIAN